MKNALKLVIPALGISCLVLILGIFIGRKSISPPENTRRENVTETTVCNITQININTANQAQLQALPGVGETLAQRIIDYRTANGPFTSFFQLKRVEGIGDAKLEAIIPYICLEDIK